MNARSKLTNDKTIHALASGFEIRHSDLIIHATFVIRI